MLRVLQLKCSLQLALQLSPVGHTLRVGAEARIIRQTRQTKGIAEGQKLNIIFSAKRVEAFSCSQTCLLLPAPTASSQSAALNVWYGTMLGCALPRRCAS